jgi:hypothetical protein
MPRSHQLQSLAVRYHIAAIYYRQGGGKALRSMLSISLLTNAPDAYAEAGEHVNNHQSCAQATFCNMQTHLSDTLIRNGVSFLLKRQK